MTDGQLRELQPNAPRSDEDEFFFKFFRINSDHVNKINSFILDGARSNVVFASPKNFTETLEWYMTDTSQTWKNVVGTEDERHLKVTLLTKLSALMKSLGSNAEPVWEESPTAKSKNTSLTGKLPIDFRHSAYQMIMDDIIKEMDRDSTMMESSPTPFLELYTKLGKFDDFLFMQDAR